MKARTNTAPLEDLLGEVHDKKAGKTWISLLDCIICHLQTVFHYDETEVVKFIMMDKVTKPNRVLIKQLFVSMAQLNALLRVCLTCSTV